MDLLAFVKHGAARAGNPAQAMASRRSLAAQQRHDAERALMITKARDLWRDALTVDETRGWLSKLEANTEVLSGLAAVLSLAAFAQVVDTTEDDPKVRVIRGALRAIEQAGEAGSVITHELLVAVSSAARTASEIVDACSDDAIEHAAHYMHALAKHHGAV